MTSKYQEASTNESDNYFKTTSTASQYFMQSAYGGIQSHGELKWLNLGGQEGKAGQGGIFSIKISPSWKLCEHQPPPLLPERNILPAKSIVEVRVQ